MPCTIHQTYTIHTTHDNPAHMTNTKHHTNCAAHVVCEHNTHTGVWQKSRHSLAHIPGQVSPDYQTQVHSVQISYVQHSCRAVYSVFITPRSWPTIVFFNRRILPMSVSCHFDKFLRRLVCDSLSISFMASASLWRQGLHTHTHDIKDRQTERQRLRHTCTSEAACSHVLSTVYSQGHDSLWHRHSPLPAMTPPRWPSKYPIHNPNKQKQQPVKTGTISLHSKSSRHAFLNNTIIDFRYYSETWSCRRCLRAHQDKDGRRRMISGLFFCRWCLWFFIRSANGGIVPVKIKFNIGRPWNTQDSISCYAGAHALQKTQALYRSMFQINPLFEYAYLCFWKKNKQKT